MAVLRGTVFWVLLSGSCYKEPWHFSRLEDFCDSWACPSHRHLSPSTLRVFWTAALEDNYMLFWLGQWKENQGLTALGETPHMDSLCSKLFRKIKDSFPRVHSQLRNNNWSTVWTFLRLLIILINYSPEILYQFILMPTVYETGLLAKILIVLKGSITID